MAAQGLRVLQGGDAERDADVALVGALKQGDAGADLAAWNRYAGGVDRTIRRLLGPGPDREDLIQEVFIRFFRNIHALREPTAVRGYLTGICIHVVQWEIAARRRRRWFQLTATGEVPSQADGAALDGPARAADAREAVSRYYRLVDTLKTKERSIFVSRTIEGLKLEEVATLHGVSVSTAQRRLRRATARIATLVRRDPALAEFVTQREAKS